MGLINVLNKWKELGHTYVSWDTAEAYWILLIEDGKVVGHVKTVSGSISWCYPDELITKKVTVKEE